MIVVTGVPRSRTSLVMQTLGLLGVPKTGKKYTFRNIPKHNKKGYWELDNSETQNGIKSHEYKGKAVKLFGLTLELTPPEYVEKVIWCTRWKNHAVKSFVRLLEDNPSFGLKANRKNAEDVYKNNYEKIESYLKKNKEVPYMKIDYKAWLYPRVVINDIVEFLNLGDVDISNAVENVEV